MRTRKTVLYAEALLSSGQDHQKYPPPLNVRERARRLANGTILSFHLEWIGHQVADLGFAGSNPAVPANFLPLSSGLNLMDEIY